MGNTAWKVDEIGDQTGRVALLTGANSGIGFETAKVLAGRGGRVVLGCRNVASAQESRRRMIAANPEADVDVLKLDLADLGSVADAAATLGEREQAVDLLVNNAAVIAVPHGFTADGFELQFGTNHLGHFALTLRLLDLLEASGTARIVTVASNAHKVGRIDLSNLMGERRYRRARQYGVSKLANLMFAYELQRRLAAAGATTISLAAHPGTTRTHWARDAGTLAKVLTPLRYPLSHDAATGALPTLRAALDPAASGGEYYGPSGPGGFTGPVERVESSRASHDPVIARRLWTVSEELTGVTFPTRR